VTEAHRMQRVDDGALGVEPRAQPVDVRAPARAIAPARPSTDDRPATTPSDIVYESGLLRLRHYGAGEDAARARSRVFRGGSASSKCRTLPAHGSKFGSARAAAADASGAGSRRLSNARLPCEQPHIPGRAYRPDGRSCGATELVAVREDMVTTRYDAELALTRMLTSVRLRSACSDPP
jgi:hypothetical protein